MSDIDRGEDFDAIDPDNYDAEDVLYCVGGPLPKELEPEEALLCVSVFAGVGT